MSDNEKIAFLNIDVLMALRFSTPSTPKERVKGYEEAIQIIEHMKQYLINKQSDEQNRQEI